MGIAIDRSGNRSNVQANRTITARWTEVRAILPLSIVDQEVLNAYVRPVGFLNRTNDHFSSGMGFTFD